MDAILTTVERARYSGNLLPTFCRFDNDYQWNEMSGGGNIDANNLDGTENSYTGNGHCKILFTGSSAGVFNNNLGGTAFTAQTTGNYLVSFALKKSLVGMTASFMVTAVINGAEFDFNCDLAPVNGFNDKDWNLFFFNLELNQYDDVDFYFTTQSSNVSQQLLFDRFKVELDDRSLGFPSYYTAPAPEKMEWTMRTDTANTQNLTASTDNTFGFAGDLQIRDAVTLISTTGEITPRKLLRALTIDYAFDVTVPSGTNNYIDVMLTVDGVVYRANSIAFLKNTGTTQHISGSWTLPVGTSFYGVPALIKLNPTANCTISNRFLGVVEHV